MNSQSLTFVLYSNPQLKDPFDAATAERFLVYRQLVRSLTSIDAHGALSGDLAKSWKVSGDHRVFIFQLNDAKWSDGMRVLASDFVRTFEEGKKAPFSVHFDHSKVKKVSAPNDYTFEIEFTKPHPNALYQLSLPEAGLLYRRDFEHTDPRLFRITPGAYSLVKNEPGNISLNRNNFFEHASTAPKQIHFEVHSAAAERFIPVKNADIVWPVASINDNYEKLVDEKTYRRVFSGFGWTNFFSINSKNLRNIAFRRYLQRLLEPGFFDLTKHGTLSESAKQLFMTNGPSQLSSDWVSRFWKELPKEKPAAFPNTLKIAAAPNSVVTPRIIEIFAQHGIGIEQLRYNDLTSALLDQKYDFALINNDFSSADLLENLNVTFSGKYVNVSSESEIPKLMKTANAEPSLEIRTPLYREVGKALLTEGLVVPFCYQMVRHFVSARVNPTNLEDALLEFKMWKVTMQDAPKAAR